MKACTPVQPALVAVGILLINCAAGAPAEVRSSADIRNSGEVSGQVSFCNGALSASGTTVDLVGESYSAHTAAVGLFNLRFVVEGSYTLRVRIPGQPAHTQPVQVVAGQVTDVGIIERCADSDADGFTPDPNDLVAGGDCDDDNAFINPIAVEICDGVDNNCDGVVDGANCTACTDSDNDGFYAQGVVCGTDTDCDDDDSAIRPNAAEQCDGIDNNCMMGVDEGFDLSTDPTNCGACSNVCGSGQCADSVCQLECGNGIVEPSIGETCDDGNSNNNDACPDGIGGTCQTAMCGDGFIDASGGESCDDGNSNNSDACVACQPAVCGDGFVQTGIEACDDGNAVNGDGCENDCTVTPAFECTPGESELCQTGEDGVCADGIRTCSAAGTWEDCIQLDDAEPEICDGLDNDCDGLTDEDFDLSSDSDNCGFCGNACIDQGAASCGFDGQCITGQCSVYPAGTACDDSDPQTVGDVCDGTGSCVGTGG